MLFYIRTGWNKLLSLFTQAMGPNIDSRLIQSLIIKEYTLKEQYDQQYLKECEKEKLVNTHSTNHKEIVNTMHLLTENIKLIQHELEKLSRSHTDVISTVKKPLNLHTIFLRNK